MKKMAIVISLILIGCGSEPELYQELDEPIMFCDSREIPGYVCPEDSLSPGYEGFPINFSGCNKCIWDCDTFPQDEKDQCLYDCDVEARWLEKYQEGVQLMQDEKNFVCWGIEPEWLI